MRISDIFLLLLCVTCGCVTLVGIHYEGKKQGKQEVCKSVCFDIGNNISRWDDKNKHCICGAK